MTRHRLAHLLLVPVAAVLVGCGTETAPPVPAPSSPAASVSAPAPGGSIDVGRVPAGRELAVFKAALAQRQMTLGANDAETETYARLVCQQLDAGVPTMVLAEDVRAGTGFDPTDTGFVIGAASGTYCPQHLQRLSSGG